MFEQSVCGRIAEKSAQCTCIFFRQNLRKKRRVVVLFFRSFFFARRYYGNDSNQWSDIIPRSTTLQ